MPRETIFGPGDEQPDLTAMQKSVLTLDEERVLRP